MYRYSAQGPPLPVMVRYPPAVDLLVDGVVVVVVGLGRAPLTRDGFPEPVPIQSMYGIFTYHKNNQMYVNILYHGCYGVKISYSFCIILQKILLKHKKKGNSYLEVWRKVWIIWLYVTCLVLCKTETYRAAGHVSSSKCLFRGHLDIHPAPFVVN